TPSRRAGGVLAQHPGRAAVPACRILSQPRDRAGSSALAQYAGRRFRQVLRRSPRVAPARWDTPERARGSRTRELASVDAGDSTARVGARPVLTRAVRTAA